MNKQQFILNVKNCQEAVRRFLTALCCGDSSLADDLAQDSFMKAFLKISDLKDESKFRSWIFSIAYKTFISYRRAAKPTETIETANSSYSDLNADDSFRYESLYRALGNLSEKERSSLLFYYMEGYNLQEISIITGQSVDAIKQHLSRGRRNLSNILKFKNLQ